MTDVATRRCENLACLCDVPVVDETCSPYCESPDGRDPQNVVCSCAHAGCAEQMERQLHDEGGRESL
jgi:hypothetical protein